MEIINSWWMQRPFAFEDSGGKYSPFAFHLWDRLLKEGGRTWGVAGCCSVQPRDVGRSWINVWVENGQPTAEDLVNAIRAGQFYVSTVSTPIDPSLPDPPGVKNPKNQPLTGNGTKNDPGVAINEIKIDTNGAGEPKSVTIDTDATNVYAIVDGSPRLTVPKASSGTFTTFPFPDSQRFGKNSKYIRFECVAADDNWDESYDWDNTQQVNRSWTQPIWVTP